MFHLWGFSLLILFLRIKRHFVFILALSVSACSMISGGDVHLSRVVAMEEGLSSTCEDDSGDVAALIGWRESDKIVHMIC